MKVYVVLISSSNGSHTKVYGVYGVYKQYRHACQEKERLLGINKTLWSGDPIDVQIVDQEVTE